MMYLLSTLLWWLLAALALGVVVGVLSCRRRPVLEGLGWMLPLLLVLGAGVVVAVARLLPGTLGYWLEIALLMTMAYLVGCTVGCLFGRRAAEEPVAAAAGAVAVTAAAREVVKAPPAPVPVPVAPAAPALPSIRPYQWQASRDGDAITLSGYVPDEATRGALLAAARMRTPNVTDKLRLASGAPADLGAMAAAAIGHLGRLDKGIASLIDTRYTLTGSTENADAHRDVMASVKALPPGFQLAKVDVLGPPPPVARVVEPAAPVVPTSATPDVTEPAPVALAATAPTPSPAAPEASGMAQPAAPAAPVVAVPAARAEPEPAPVAVASTAPLPPPAASEVAHEPFRWSATLSASALRLEGGVATEESRGRIVAMARDLAAPRAVIDALRIVDHAPAGLETMAGEALAELARLETGSAAIYGRSYSLMGHAPDAAVKDGLMEAVAALPYGFILGAVHITAPAASAPPMPAPAAPAPETPAAEAPPPSEDGHDGNRPVGLAEPRGGKADDLKRIRGIGKQNEGRLHALGIWHFDQIAAWTPAEVRWVGSYLAFPGRIEREEWVKQAAVLAAGEDTEFSRRVARGEVATSLDDGSEGQDNIAELPPRRE